MKVSLNWLREFVDVPTDTADIAQRLSFAGIEVAAIEPAIPAFQQVRVGRVESATPHPSADRLRVCKVDVGNGNLLQIVCGATNVRVGMKAPVVLPGGRLPDGTEIQQTVLRGVDSSGMLCSARELGLSEEASDLFELPLDAPVGMLLEDYLGGADHIIEIEITPNRGDCLGVLGIARELSALYDLPLKHASVSPVVAVIKDMLPVEVKARQACPVYAGRVLRGLKSDAVTPIWMRERLRRAGLRAVHPVVDVTQYVMLELGQPMHAYDLKKLDGGIVVRMAAAGEPVKLLDGNSYKLEKDMLVIADGKRLQGAAGIMGAADSSVQPGAQDLFLEAAYFNPAAISGRPERLGLLTDAAYRFERGVDPAGQARALERATQLLMEIAGSKPGPLVVQEDYAQRPAHMPIRLRRARLAAILGIKVADAAVARILSRLGIVAMADREGWSATSPSHRFDLEIEEDLIEEVGRIYGYDHIPSVQYPSRHGMQRLPEARVDLRRLRQVLVERGYQEVVTYSFVDVNMQKLLYGSAGLPLANPITTDMAEMRLGLWAGLLKTLQYNLYRQQERIRIFETGLRFSLQHNEIKQEYVIAGLVSGPQFPLQWGLPSHPVNFADLKSDLEGLATLGGPDKRLQAMAATHPALHPRQAAHLHLNGRELGWMGVIHPAVVKTLDLPQDALVFELLLEPLLQGKIPIFEPISRFPALRRDLAVVVAEEVSAAELLGQAREAIGKLLQDIRIFDIYRGPRIDSGRKSVALGLILQDSSRTLTDEAADVAMACLAERLQHELGATIRD